MGVDEERSEEGNFSEEESGEKASFGVLFFLEKIGLLHFNEIEFSKYSLGANIGAFDSKTNEEVVLKLQCANSVDRDELLALLRSSEIEERESKSKYLPPDSFEIFEEQDETEIGVSIENWKVGDFLKIWAKEVIIGAKYDKTLLEVGEEAIRKHNLNGKSLMNDWEENDIKTLVSEIELDRSSQRRVKKELEYMVNKGRYDHSFNRITNKVIKMLNTREKELTRIEIMKCRKEFGSRNIIEKKILYYLLGESVVESTDEEWKESTSYSFPVKINIVENFDLDRRRRLRKILGRVLEVKDLVIKQKSSRFGFFHLSMAIGNLQLEYVDSELVIVREVSSDNAILSTDVGVLQVTNPEMFARNLAERVLRWNVESKYDIIKSSEFVGNCQVFVMEMLKFLKIEWKASSRVNSFIEEMKYRGTCEVIFKFDRKFGEVFFPTNSERDQTLRKNGHFAPKSHEEFDRFVCGLFKKNKSFDRDYNGEYMLLKGFDRAFWLRHKSGGNCPPLRRDSRVFWRFSGCPFTKPRSGSFGMKSSVPGLRSGFEGSSSGNALVSVGKMIKRKK